MSAPNQTPGTPAPPAAPSPTPLAESPAALQQQLTGLYAQRSGLRAQQDVLKRELDAMRLDNPGRPSIQNQDAQVALQLAQVEGNIALTEAKLGKQGTVTSTRAPNGFDGFNGHITFGKSIPVSLSLLLAIAVVLPFTMARARRSMRGGPAENKALSELPQRLDRMEQAIDAIAIEMERVSESQRYMTKVFAERGSSAPNDNDAGAPIRAVGAGPAQPIVVPEREGVRERSR